jgi:hypothetical protein
MTITVNLDPELEMRLREESRRSGESVDAVAARVLADTFRTKQEPRQRFEVKAFYLNIPEKWSGLSPQEIDYEMEIEAYEEKLERARHESPDIRL